MKWILTLLVLVVVGCSKPPPPTPPVDFTQEDIAQLKLGMSREEVKAIFGKPSYDDGALFLTWEKPDTGESITCTFHPEGSEGKLYAVDKLDQRFGEYERILSPIDAMNRRYEQELEAIGSSSEAP
ncbi:MAG: outer membrane protein assembly factor BamE [Planctomycetaceae bacterium]|nr:outer membrane protein assembly factor BamE [Planctomycetaceae bacterium]